MRSDADLSEPPVKRPRLKPNRVRQACEPCRRKKAKCDGKRPVCSLCTRLQQPCDYDGRRSLASTAPRETSAEDARIPEEGLTSTASGDDGTQSLDNRIARIVEIKLAEAAARQRLGSYPSPQRGPRTLSIEGPSDNLGLPNQTMPPWAVIIETAKNYLLYCDCQPLPLFHPDTFLETLPYRKPEVVLSILALASRFNESFEPNTDIDIISSYSEDARKIAMKSVAEGEVELATIQTLCLLSLLDFSRGNPRRASIHCSLGMSLAYSAGLASEPPVSISQSQRVERRLCFWSLYIVKQLHGPVFGILEFPEEDDFPAYPKSTPPPKRPSDTGNPAPVDEQIFRVGPPDDGILHYAIDMAMMWSRITTYARRRGKPSKLAPWAPGSEYQNIMSTLMETETLMPSIHRFKPAEFSKRTPEDLHTNRRYWGPWLFTQFMYHTNLCLLNHPLLLSLRLRNFKRALPETFLQHTADLIASHSSWMIHFLDMLEAKSFRVTDPFLAHCMAIVATICLQESLTDDIPVREEKQANFMKCLEFVRGFGRCWPHVDRIADKLQRLGETVFNSQPAQTPTRNQLIDLGQFWEILEYSTSSETYSRSSNLFGPSLFSVTPPIHNYTELAHTSSLPKPSRVDGQDFATPVATLENSPIVGQQTNGGYVLESGGSLTQQEQQQQQSLLFSNDELAVLAESLFPQRMSEIDTPGEGWWNTGNL